MERPEDVSLLANGGAPPTLIPVQGGGGSIPWEGYNAEQSVLANAGGETPQITPVQGGGQISNIIGWLAGAPGTDISSKAPSMPNVLTPETAVNTLWTNLDDIDKLGAVTDTVQKVAAINAEGGDDMQLANGIVYGLTESVLERIDRKYGTAPDLSGLEDKFKYATDAQIEAGTEAYRNNCSGKDGQELNKCIAEAMEAAADSPDPTYVQTSRLNLKRGIVPDEAKKTYTTYENNKVFRNEYRLNQEAVIDIHPVTLWMQYLYKAHIGINSETSSLFRKFIQFYIQEQKKVWEHTKQLSKMVAQYPLATLSAAGGIYTILETEVSTFPRRVVCLQKTIEHIVVVPPLDNLKYDDVNDINIKEKFKCILRDLYDMNILKIEEESTKYTCKINKKVALIFPECYTALVKETSDDIANNVLVALYTLELTNPNNVFVMTEYNKGASIDNSVKYGNYLLSRIKLNTPPITQIIPNFLSPTHVIFPYKFMSNVNGFLISSEEEDRKEKAYNIFTGIYKNKNYGGTGFGLFVGANYSFTKLNSGIIRYNYSVNFTKFLFKTDINVVRDIKGDIETVLRTLDDTIPAQKAISDSISGSLTQLFKAIDPGEKFTTPVIDAIQKVAKGCTLYFTRSVFIVIMELFLYLNKNVESLTTEIIKAAGDGTPSIDITAEKETLKNRIKAYLDDYINKRYVEYLRYPLTESYQYYKKLSSLKGQPLTEIYPPPVQTAGGRRKKTKRLQIGGAGSCSQLELTDRTAALGKFDVEQYAPYNIFVLSFKKKEDKNSVCELVNSDFPGNTGNAFSEWHNKVDIAGISALEIIDVGEKTYAIRSGRDDNNLEISDLNTNIKMNWEGYTEPKQGGGGTKLEEYEAQYDKLLNEITTTLGAQDGPTIAGGAIAADPVIHALYTSTMTCVSTISSTLCNISTSVLYYTDYPVNIINSADKIIKLTMRSIDTILDLKKSVEAKFGIPSREQHYFTIKPASKNQRANAVTTTLTIPYVSTNVCVSTISSPTCYMSTSRALQAGGANTTSFATVAIDNLPDTALLNGMITLDALGSLHDALNNCLLSIDPSFSSSIISIKNTDNTVTYYNEQQSGGGNVVNINMEFSMTGLTDKVNLTQLDASIDGSPFILKFQVELQKKFPGAMTRPLESDLHCPTGEMPDNTPVRCIPNRGSSPGIYFFTTKELYGTPTEQPSWIPTIVTGAVVGAVGLGALALSGESPSEIQKKKDGLLATTNVSPGGGGTYLQRKNAPILVKGEADLLNDLNLTPINMSEIFNVENKYATLYPNLAVWHKAIPAFFENLTTRKCYNNSLLLTRSECEETKCFLYSIRDYLNKGTGPPPNMNIMKGDVSELNEPDIEADTDIVFSNTNMDPPQYRVEEEKATVRAAAIEKRTNHRWHFDIQLKDKAKDTKGNIVTPEEKEQLLEMFQNLKTKYPNYVLYLY